MHPRTIVTTSLLAACTLAACRGGDSPPAAPDAIVPAPFAERFDGAPASPQSWFSRRWAITVHTRDASMREGLEPLVAMHGADCSAPPASHVVADFHEAVFQCRDHMMTAIDASGYGLVSLVPDGLLDFSGPEGATLRFAMSTERRSPRDWITIWVTPFEDNLQLVGGDGRTDLDGPPRNGIFVQMEGGPGATRFTGWVVRDYYAREVAGQGGRTWDEVLAPSATRRDTFELHVTPTHVRFGMPQYGLWWADGDVLPLSWTRGVVQLDHNAMDAAHGCTGCGATTWHWDDLTMSSAVPFTILHADRRLVDAAHDWALRFESDAPRGAWLRFAAVGQGVEVSTDGGRRWSPALRQQTQRGSATGRFTSYWMPVPAGTREISIRATDDGATRWQARDITIWAAPGGR